MTERRAPRRVGYPKRWLGRALEAGVEAKKAQSPNLTSDAAVANWLGYKRGVFSSWLTGRTHPDREDDWRNLARLPGVTRESLKKAELMDKLYALMIDQDQGARELAITALEIWEADDQREEIPEILEKISRLGARPDRARR